MINWRTQSTGNSDLELAPQSFTTRPIFVAVSAHPSMCTSVCVWGRGRMADWHPRTKILKPEGSHATNTSSTRSAAPWLTDFFARSPMAGDLVVQTLFYVELGLDSRTRRVWRVWAILFGSFDAM